MNRKGRALLWLMLLGLFTLFFSNAGFFVSEAKAAERISVKEAREKVMSGQALLVCAYISNDIFNVMRLEGAISLRTFMKKLNDIKKDQMIIFYCA
jgi:phage FluMu protein gp41